MTGPGTTKGRAPARPKVVAYLRVSTDKQAEHGLGLEVQEQAIRKWAKAGYRIVGWARDEGVSGSNGLDARVGLYEAIGQVQHGQAAGIVVYRLDRLARDLVLQEQLLAEIRRMGGELFTTSAAEASYLTDDPDDPSRKLIRQILGAVNEYERALIRLRLKAGRARKREKGGYADGSPPYGFRAERGELVPVPEEQGVLGRIRELVASGASLREIGRTLTAEGFAPRPSPLRRHPDQWAPQTLRRIIDRLS